jgi:hypothetical protein
MVERGEDLGFALEASHTLSVCGEGFRQNLQRYVALQFRVLGAVNLAHPARADQADNLVRA